MTPTRTPPVPFTEPTPAIDISVNIKQRQRFCMAIHRALIILDDYLCDELGFSRKPQGKYKSEVDT